MTTLILADRLPAEGRGWYAHYDHVPLAAPGWRRAELRAVLDTHADAWLDDYDAWHAEVCRRGCAVTPWWWLMSASRPNVWVHHELVKPLFLAAALREWADAHPDVDTIVVVGAPAELAAHAKDFGLRAGGRGVAPARRVAPIRRVLGDIAGHTRQWLGEETRRPPAPVTTGTLFYSHVLRAADLARTGDHFFGDMPGAVDATVTYLLHDPGERAEAERALSGRASFLLDHLTRGDVAWVVANALRAWRRGRALALPPVRLGRHVSASFAARFRSVELAARTPVIELAVFRAMGRLVDASPALRTVVYPYEEKGVERALLAAVRGRGIVTAGFAHAAHTRSHLALRSRTTVATAPPQPDRVLATGLQAREFLVTWARKPAATTIAVGSPRHRTAFAGRRRAAARRSGLRVLVLAGHGFELGQLATLVAERSPFVATDEVVVRRYDYAWAKAQAEGIRRLGESVPQLRVGEGPLAEQLAWADVAIFDSTTAGVQAMQAGCLGVGVRLHEVFETEPLLGAPGIFARCRSIEELAAALATARALDDAGYDAWSARQRALADSILAPLDAGALMTALHRGVDTTIPVLAGAAR